MSTERMDFISLCYISGELDSNGNPWLNRIADVEDGKLVPPRKSERPTKYFDAFVRTTGGFVGKRNQLCKKVSEIENVG